MVNNKLNAVGEQIALNIAVFFRVWGFGGDFFGGLLGLFLADGFQLGL